MIDRARVAAKAVLTLNRMRTCIFVGMVFVSLIPIGLAMRHAHDTAFQRELDKVEQAHLIIAQNLTSTLQRYVEDVRATFDFVTAAEGAALDEAALAALLGHYDFRFVGIAPAGSDSARTLHARDFAAPSAAQVAEMRAAAVPGETVLSGVRQVDGAAVLTLTRRDAAGRLAIGIIDTGYVVAQQRAIAFGERGHAMIVDHAGRVLAHPDPDWTRSAKDASGLAVVQRMLAGQTGVMQFFSPPLQADMIAGYTHLPTTGWGVMVPQPVAELAQAARLEAGHATQLLALFFVLAAGVSWALSGLIARPVDALAGTVRRVRDGDRAARVPAFARLAPQELVALRAVFNGLLDSWSESRAMLERSLAAARRANAMKSRAISVLSHEMRTPLNGIVGAVELLDRTPLSTAQAGYLGILDTSARTLLAHVHDVLEVGRLDSGAAVIEPADIDLRALLRDIVTENTAQAQAAGNRIALDLSDSVPPRIRTDPRMLRTILANLVGNAVKFTRAGRIDIRATLDAEGRLDLQVADTGPGIRESDRRRVFEPFCVVNASYARAEGGTGLGLCIVAMSVEAMGGTVEVQGEVGVGSVFRTRLPVAPCAREAAPEAPEAPDASRAGERDAASGARACGPGVPAQRVLVVDDNEVNRAMLAAMLRDLGHAVSLAADGPEALETAMARPFDLILLDISMPDVDGTEVARLLRDHDGPNRATRIVAQTAHASPDDRDAFVAAGIDDALIKPIRVADLDRVLRGETAAPEAATGGTGGTTGPQALRAIDPERFAVLAAAQGSAKARESLRRLLRESAEVIGDLETGPENDAPRRLARVHNAAGATAMLGAELLHARLRAIESRLKHDAGAAVDDLAAAAREALGRTRDAADGLEA